MERNRFEEILRSENKKIFNYLLKILRDREDAEDILQETFLAFYKKMDVVSDETYLSYLYRTAHNKALNHIKKRKKQNKFSSNYSDMDYIAEEKENPVDDVKENAVRQALAKLPEKYILLLELQFYQKKSYKEIADILEMSVGAVDSKLVRVKKKLKKIIMQDSKQNGVLINRGEKNEQGTMQIFG
jgi:RNA polymerase sigma-70 factor, ECF subfamily